MVINRIIAVITNPQWVTAMTTILAVLVALFGSNIISNLNRPKIVVGLSNKSPYVVQMNDRNGVFGKYLRLKILNNGKTVARGCRVKILSVVSENSNNIPSIIEQDILKWTSAPLDRRYCHESFVPKDMNQLVPIHKQFTDISPSGGWEMCDLLVITTGNNAMFLSSGGRYPHFKNKDYLVSLEISGENFAPKKLRIKLSNPNSFEHIRIS